MTYTTEVHRRIYIDDEGVYINVGPDTDGLGCVEISTKDKKSIEYFGEVRLTFDKQFAKMLGQALIAAASE